MTLIAKKSSKKVKSQIHPEEEPSTSQASKTEQNSFILVDLTSKIEDFSSKIGFGVTIKQVYTPILIITISNYLDTISKFSRLLSLNSGTQPYTMITWSIYIAKFFLSSAILYTYYSDFIKLAPVKGLTKLDMFSIFSEINYTGLYTK